MWETKQLLVPCGVLVLYVNIGLGNMIKKSYLGIFWGGWFVVNGMYISVFCILIKQIHKYNECDRVGIYYLQKMVKITLHSNIVTLQSKNKNNTFKAEVTFTKLKMKVKKAQTNWVKRLFWLPHYSHFTVSAIIQIHLIAGLKFDISHIYCPTTNSSAKSIF